MHDHTHQHAPNDHFHGNSMAALLDLDAKVHRPYLDALLDRVAEQLGREPHTIVDIGAGTGAGTFALAGRFPRAEVIAVDQSTDMLDRLRNAARHNGLDTRVRTVEADLDSGWPAIDSADFVWAALSLHHIEDPDALLRQLLDVLNPDGMLVITEMASPVRFLPDDIGIGAPGLEIRCQEAADTQRWDVHPDWSDNLRRAGFDVAGVQRIDIDIAPVDHTAREYAHAVLSRTREGLEKRLSADDLDVLDRLVSEHGPDSVLHRSDLAVRGARNVWMARRSTKEEAR
ncbi:class I SAM-dependent methyltransferase [Rhodococcus chondri]|uniref:Class I SAM-dependent methyltransferase n=1 Tax=Rhodococcus chondri TaxID=3065941 RepID=A0ABU7JTR5_9NOCA|nr:class I SAM-dependent methyltransferase [Rhodococcus sp. CC-R104]MEE2033426.1 class I SAM-dependent methyltransferase [Rhodococcus sp. CC-R104]